MHLFLLQFFLFINTVFFCFSFNRVQDIIVFIIGGVTYEESLAIHQLNHTSTIPVRVILGGTTIHNSQTFLQEVLNATQHLPISHSRMNRNYRN